MKNIKYIGIALFFVGFCMFHYLILGGNYKITKSSLTNAITNTVHFDAISKHIQLGSEQGLFETVSSVKSAVQNAQVDVNNNFEKLKTNNTPLPNGMGEWDYKIGDGNISGYAQSITKASIGESHLSSIKTWGLLSFLLCIVGALLWISSRFNRQPGIQNDGLFHNPLTRGITAPVRNVLLIVVGVGILVYGYLTKSTNWAIISVLIALLIAGLVFWYENKTVTKGSKSIAPNVNGYAGIALGLYLISFYVLLYWAPAYLVSATKILDPLSIALSGNPASQWFLYGFLYTVAMIVMGIRMYAKYRHDKYQLMRTGSVVFFQLTFAFLLPEILVKLNMPYHDFKNIWPLDYDFLFDWNINSLIANGTFGIFILVWGIFLAIVGVPLMTYFFGKRWYCSWVCGCGGLAETAGDPFRQMSDNSLKAWRVERYVIHGVFVAAIVMTVLVLYTFFTGNYQFLGMESYQLRSWYGFLIGAGFSGVVGTGFYPVMGNRVWCRFGCPLAGYLGIVQRFFSRYRITTNGGQCISCGNCSTYCEMGIDVRSYAQKGQDIVRSSCVGCGICSAVCPRGVLRLENSDLDIKTRTKHTSGLVIDGNGAHFNF